MDSNFLVKMAKSIFDIKKDFFIFIFFIFSLICFVLVLLVKNEINDETEKMESNPDWAIKLRKRLNLFYSLFTTMITIFPLLGMFGTVIALLNLNFSGVDVEMENIKNNFFNALTSTAWGIVFSVLFKCANAFIAPGLSDTLIEIEKIIEKNDVKNQIRLVKDGKKNG